MHTLIPETSVERNADVHSIEQSSKWENTGAQIKLNCHPLLQCQLLVGEKMGFHDTWGLVKGAEETEQSNKVNSYPFII